MTHYSHSFPLQIHSKPCLHPSHLLLHPLLPWVTLFSSFFSSNTRKTLSIVLFTPSDIPFDALFSFFSSSSPLKTLLSFLSNLLHPIFPQSLSFLILFSSNTLKTLSIVPFYTLLVPLTHYSHSFPLQIHSKPCLHPSHLLLHPLLPWVTLFSSFFSSNTRKTLSIVLFTPSDIPFDALFSFFSSSSPLKTLLSFLSNLLHPIFPQSLSFLILFSSNTLKTLSIVPFYTLLVPLTHYSHSFPLQIHSKPCLHPSHLLLHPLLPWVTLFSSFFSSNTRKTLSIVLFTPSDIPFDALFSFFSSSSPLKTLLSFLSNLLHPIFPQSLSFLILFSSNTLKTLSIVPFYTLLVPLTHYSHSFPLQIHSKPCLHPSHLLLHPLLPWVTLFSSFFSSNTRKTLSIVLFTPSDIPFDALFSFFSSSSPLKTLLSFLSNLLHPIFPQSLSFLILFSSNTLKTLSIVPFYTLLVPLTHYSHSFPLQIHSKPCLHPSHLLLHPLLPWVTLFSSFFSSNTRKTLSIVLFTPSDIPFDALFSFFSSSSPLKTLLSFLSNLLHPIFPQSLSFLILFSSNTLKTLSIVPFYTLLVPLTHYSHSFPLQIHSKPCLHPSHLLLHPLLPWVTLFSSFFSSNTRKTLSIVLFTPSDIPFDALFSFFSSSSPLKTLLSFLSNLLHPIFPQSLSFLILFSSNTLKTLSIVPFYTLLVPLTHYSHSFPLQIHSKPCLHPSHLLLHPLLPWVTLFSSFFSSNTRKTLSIVLFTPSDIPFDALFSFFSSSSPLKTLLSFLSNLLHPIFPQSLSFLILFSSNTLKTLSIVPFYTLLVPLTHYSHSFPLQIHSKPCLHPSHLLLHPLLPWVTLFSSFFSSNTRKTLSIVLFTPSDIPFDALFSFFSSSSPLKTLLSFLSNLLHPIFPQSLSFLILFSSNTLKTLSIVPFYTLLVPLTHYSHSFPLQIHSKPCLHPSHLLLHPLLPWVTLFSSFFSSNTRKTLSIVLFTPSDIPFDALFSFFSSSSPLKTLLSFLSNLLHPIFPQSLSFLILFSSNTLKTLSIVPFYTLLVPLTHYSHSFPLQIHSKPCLHPSHLLLHPLLPWVTLFSSFFSSNTRKTLSIVLFTPSDIPFDALFSFFSSSSPLKTLLSFLSNLLHPIFPQSLSFLILFSSNTLKTLSIVPFYTLLVPLTHYSHSFPLQIHSKPCLHPSHLLLHPLLPWVTLFSSFFSSNTRKTLSIVLFTPSDIPFDALFSFFSSSSPLKTLLSFLSNLLHPIFPQSLSFLILFSSNTLKTLSIVPFYTLLVPLTHYSHSFPLQIHSKPCLHPSHLLLHPLLPWVTLFSSFFSSNTRKTLSIVLFTPSDIPFDALFSFFSSSSPLKTLLSFLSNLLHPIFPQSLSFLILFSSNTLKTLSIVPFYTLLVPLTHYSHSFPLQIHSKPCLHPSHLLLHPLLPWVTLFSSFFSSNTRKTLSIVLFTPSDIPFDALFSFFSSSSPLKTLLSFLSNLLHPIFPQSLSFLILFSSNTLKTLSIVPFYTLLVPLTHYSHSFPLQIHSKPCLHPSHLLLHPLLPWVTLFSSFFSSNTRKTLSIVLFTPSDIPFDALFSFFSSSSPLKTLLSFLSNLLHPIFPQSLSFLILFSSNTLKTLSIVPFYTLLVPLTHYSHSFPLQIHSKPCLHPSHLLLHPLLPWVTLFSSFFSSNTRKTLSIVLFTPSDIPFDALFSFFSSSSPLKTLLSFLSNLLHPIFPQSLSFLILFSSNTLKTLSIVPFYTLLVPLTHYSHSFPLQIHSKPCLHPSHLLLHPLLPWVTLFSSFFSSNTRKTLSIVLFTPSDIPFDALFSFFSSSSPLKTLLSFLSNLLHPIFPQSLSFLILLTSNTLKTLSIVPFYTLLVPLTHYSHSFPLQIHSKPCLHPSHLLLHPLLPWVTLFSSFFSSNTLKTLSIVPFYTLLVPLWRTILILFLFKSTQNLAILPQLLLHPIFPQSLSFLILFSSNTLKTLSIVPFYTLLVPLTHYSHSFPLQIHSKPCLHPSHLLLHPLLPHSFPLQDSKPCSLPQQPSSPYIPSVFSSFFSSNTLKTLSIVPFYTLLVPLWRTILTLFLFKYTQNLAYTLLISFFTLYYPESLSSRPFSLQIHSKPYPLFLFTPF